VWPERGGGTGQALPVEDNGLYFTRDHVLGGSGLSSRSGSRNLGGGGWRRHEVE
jgi:hypothetical protein